MRNVQALLLSASLAMCLYGCGVAETPISPSAAAVSEGTYTNEYFGLTLPIPDGWYVASKDSEEFLKEVGETMIGDDPLVKATVEASKKTTFQLLTLSEHELGAPVEFNPSLILMAERVSHMPGIKSGKDYLFHSSKLLLMTQLPYEVVKDAYPAQLGDREWYREDFLINYPQMPIDQSHFATKVDKYVLLLILSAATEQQMDTLEQIAATVEFELNP